MLRLHPDLAGKLAEQEILTPESTAEQKAAGLDSLNQEEKLLLKQANEKCRYNNSHTLSKIFNHFIFNPADTERSLDSPL